MLNTSLEKSSIQSSPRVKFEEKQEIEEQIPEEQTPNQKKDLQYNSCIDTPKN